MKPSRPWLMPISGTLIRRQLPRDAQHGAVAADHDGGVGLPAYLLDGKAGQAPVADVARRLGLEQHIDAGVVQEGGELVQRLADADGAGLADNGDFLEGHLCGRGRGRRHAAD